MGIKMGFPCGSVWTMRATVRLFACVCSEVSEIVMLMVELHLAVATSKTTCLWPGRTKTPNTAGPPCSLVSHLTVMGKDMIPKCGLSAGAVWAVWALERFLPSVGTDVTIEITRLNKLSTTVGARVGWATCTSTTGLLWRDLRYSHQDWLHASTRNLQERPSLSSLL